MVFAPPLVMQGTVYLAPVVNAPWTSSLYALRASDGTLLWQAPIPEASVFPLAVADNVLYLSTSRGCLAVRPSDGTVLWQQELGAARQICSPPLVLGGKVYLSGSEGRVEFPSEESGEAHHKLHPFLCALQASDGALLWQQPLKNAPSATQPTEVILLDGRLYVGTDDGGLGAYRAEDGTPLWRYQTQGTLLSSPTGAGGKVYVGASDGCVYALGAEEGTLLWQTFVSTAATLVQSISIQGTSLHFSS
jgi:outer membrane protein assembly factor BamB